MRMLPVQSHILGHGIENAGMPRKLRVQYAGAIYHLMNRGDRRETIFEDECSHEDTKAQRGLGLACQSV